MGSSLGKPKSPDAPDYQGLAAQQGQQNLQTAQYNTNANRVNQTGPDGSISWSMRPGADPNNPQAGDWTQNTTLNAGNQAIYDSNQRLSQQYGQTAEQQMGRVNSALGQEFNTSGLPQLQGSYGYQQTAQAGAPNASVDPRTGQSQGAPTAGPVQGQVNSGNLPELGGDYGAQRQQVVDAMMSRSEPDLNNQQASRENQLINSGITRGSEAWNREMDSFGRQRNDMQMQAQLAGGQEQSRLNNMALGNRQQLYGEGVTSGNFANNAQNQQFTQGLASAGFNNDTLGQDFNRDLSAATFGNQAQGQNFAQQSQQDSSRNAYNANQAQFGNQARQQGFQEQSYLRGLPLNEANALRSGAQVNQPQFSSYYTGGNAQAAPVFDAGMAQGNYNLQAYGNKQSGYNSMLGGLAGLGSAAITTWGN